MKAIFHFLILSFILFICCNQQPKSEVEDAAKVYQSLNELFPFIPNGFKLIDEYTFDLNQDSIQDKLIIVGINDSLDSVKLSKIFSDNFDLNTRPLIILIRQPDGALRQIVRNDDALGWNQSGQYESYDEIGVTQNGLFTIENDLRHPGWQSSATMLFKYSKTKDDWFLEKYENSYASDQASDSGTYDNHSTSIKTKKDFGEISFKDYKYFNFK